VIELKWFQLFTDPELINLSIHEKETAEMMKRYPEHPGLAASKISNANNRSSKHAYILVIGLTKSGKSSTVIRQEIPQTEIHFNYSTYLYTIKSII